MTNPQPLGDHPHNDPGDGRTECDVCGKWVFECIHSCKGVPVTDSALARWHERNADFTQNEKATMHGPSGMGIDPL